MVFYVARCYAHLDVNVFIQDLLNNLHYIGDEIIHNYYDNWQFV